MLSSLIHLHEWRESFNGNDIGYGFDELKPNEKYHYPEAYAVFGRGYLKLYKVTKEQEYFKCALKCAEWLLRNSSPKYTNPSWGLPFEWKVWKASRELSYVCTTSYCGDFMIDLYEITKDDEYKDVATSIADWLIHENTYKITNGGIDFYYANHDPLKFSIYNHNALAMGFFSKLFNFNQDEKYKKIADGVSSFLISNQNKFGAWSYSEKNETIDNFHNALMIDGFTDFLITFKANDAEKAVQRSLDFYRNKFYLKNGKGREYAIKIANDSNIAKATLIYVKKQIGFGPPAKLWSYGSGIRALTKSSSLFKKNNNEDFVVNYVILNLKQENGAFAFTEEKPNKYIRNEAHIFDGLATFIQI